ncbi:MAG: hypothetical protein KatS3mg111_1198 [Pirellulaceae bacterium]|nr:MAG: hypothetical protein KatS3mg111_1198 [Pirellulaceae bacterium]
MYVHQRVSDTAVFDGAATKSSPGLTSAFLANPHLLPAQRNSPVGAVLYQIWRVNWVTLRLLGIDFRCPGPYELRNWHASSTFSRGSHTGAPYGTNNRAGRVVEVTVSV